LTHNDPYHGNPHSKAPPGFLTKDEGQNASCKTTEVVYRDDDSFQAGGWVPKRIEEIGIAYNARENTLIITK
jgi:hypothetical protein